MDRNKTGLTRAAAVGGVGLTLLFVVGGCAAVCRLDTRSHAAKPEQPEREAVADAEPARTRTNPPYKLTAMVRRPSRPTPPSRWANEPQASRTPQTDQRLRRVRRRRAAARRKPRRRGGLPAAHVRRRGRRRRRRGRPDRQVDRLRQHAAQRARRHLRPARRRHRRHAADQRRRATTPIPAFSPDGKWIAFSSTRAGNWQIYMMDIDGRNVVQVTSGPMQAIHPSFSPDGTRLVYCALGGRSGQWELWTVDLRTRREADDRLRAVPELVAGQDGRPHRVPAGPPARRRGGSACGRSTWSTAKAGG